MKVVDPTEKHALSLLVERMVCPLKKGMPPAFFDLMERMLIHLVDNLEICGPISGWWMYPLEQHMGA